MIDEQAHQDIGFLRERIDRLERLAILDHIHQHVLDSENMIQTEKAQICLELTEEHSHDVKPIIPE